MNRLARVLAVLMVAGGLAVVGATLAPAGADPGCNNTSQCVGVNNGRTMNSPDAFAGCNNEFTVCVGVSNGAADSNGSSGFAGAGCTNRAICVGGDNGSAIGPSADGGCNITSVCVSASNGRAQGATGDARGGCNNGWGSLEHMPGSVCAGISNGYARAGHDASGGCNNGSVCVGSSNGDANTWGGQARGGCNNGSVCVGTSNAHAAGGTTWSGPATGGCNNGSVCVGLSNGDGDHQGCTGGSTCISPSQQTSPYLPF